MEETSLLQNVAVLGIEVVALALITTLTLLARKGSQWVAAKANYELTSTQLGVIDDAVEKAVNFAEEWAHKEAGELGKMKGPEKMEVAGNFLLDMAEMQGFPDWVKDKVQELIEAKLGERRAD